MTAIEKKNYDKKVYQNLTEKELEKKRERQKKWYNRQKDLS